MLIAEPRRCPRHPEALEASAVRAPAAFTAERCPRCSGLWIPRDALGLAQPALAQIALHADEVLAAAARNPSRAACPGCERPLACFYFYEVPIDWCAGCGGVWLDGEELDRLAASVAEARARGMGHAAGGYRSIAAEVVDIGTVRCHACDRRVPVAQSLLTAAGTRCLACHDRLEGLAACDEAVAATQRELDATRREAELGGSLLDSLGRMLRGLVSAER